MAQRKDKQWNGKVWAQRETGRPIRFHQRGKEQQHNPGQQVEKDAHPGDCPLGTPARTILALPALEVKRLPEDARYQGEENGI